jgi:hypothetical protein
MNERSYFARAICVFLFATLFAGCGGGAVGPTVPAGAGALSKSHPSVNDVKIWAASAQANKIYGLTEDATRVVTTINTQDAPVSLKLDQSQDLWVANAGKGDYMSGNVQEYGGLSLDETYQPACLAPGCDYFLYALYDVAVSSNTVFAIMPALEYSYHRKPDGGTGYEHSPVGNPAARGILYTTGYEYWPLGNPSAPSWFIPGASCGCKLFYGDVDRSGNLWVTDEGYSSYGLSGGLAEITNPGSASPSFTQVKPFGTYRGGAPGHVSVSGNGTVLNVEITYGYSGGAKIYQYYLPVSPSSTPFNTLTICSYCNPGGFSIKKSNEQAVVADGTAQSSKSAGWLDFGQIKQDTWREVSLPQFTYPLNAATYVP